MVLGSRILLLAGRLDLGKFYEWTDCSGHPENIFSKNELLDKITLYWLTNSAASSARVIGKHSVLVRFLLIEGVSQFLWEWCFPEEIMAGPRSWSKSISQISVIGANWTAWTFRRTRAARSLCLGDKEMVGDCGLTADFV